MIKITALNKSEREELFLNTSEKVGLPPAIIEKEYKGNMDLLRR